MDEIDPNLKETRLDKDGKTSNPICCLCGNQIEDNQGLYWVKGTGGINARGVYPSKIYCVHSAHSCSSPIGKYFAQFKPDEKGEFWFYGKLPFFINTDEEPTDKDKFIYVIKSTTKCKIGIAKEPKKRMRELQTGDPVEHSVVYTSFVENAEQLERELHQHYSEFSVRGEWFELPAEKIEELLEVLQNKGFIEKSPPLNNIVYYPPGTRVLWRSKSGIVHSLEVKPYDFEIGYNIVLDEQNSKEEPDVTNAGYGELRLEETGEISREGYELKSNEQSQALSPEKTVFTLNDLLEMEYE